MITLDYAVEYAARGLHVLPVWAMSGDRCACAGGAECRPGKHPSTSRGVHDATIDRARLGSWFGRGVPANLAIVCGPSRVVVIDIDRHGVDGFATLAKLERELGALPVTWTQDSGGGGAHYVYRAPSVALVGRAGLGVDVLAGARYVIVEPSRHAAGGGYQWREALAPWDAPLAGLPDAWIDRLRRRERTPASVRRPGSAPDRGDIYAALADLDQAYVLLAISGSPLVGGETIAIAPPDRRGHRAIVIDDRVTGGFVDGAGKIVHRPVRTERPDGGPLVSTWCRHYGHGDAAIRSMLVELVPELARFRRGARRLSRRTPSALDMRGER